MCQAWGLMLPSLVGQEPLGAGGFREAALVRLIPVALGLGGCRDLLLGFAFPFGTGVPHSWVPGETPLSFLFLPTVRIFILLEIFLIFHLC